MAGARTPGSDNAWSTSQLLGDEGTLSRAQGAAPGPVVHRVASAPAAAPAFLPRETERALSPAEAAEAEERGVRALMALVTEYIHPDHVRAFVAAAKEFNCYILVRETGRAALGWVGKRGYTGKRADLKAKTADRNATPPPVAGLVCSPLLRPDSFTRPRLLGENGKKGARELWMANRHLITEPNDKRGFDDNRQPRGCKTPYLVQTNPTHRHYGCVALVDRGLLVPRYVHGDYDLYAILPAGEAVDWDPARVRDAPLISTMDPPASLTFEERLNLRDKKVANKEGPQSFQVATFINTRIAQRSPDLLGALMVNHGEQVNLGEEGRTFEPVLAIMPRPVGDTLGRILATKNDHDEFYKLIEAR